LLAGAGGGLGALFAVWALGLVKRVAPQQIPRLEELSVDWTVFAFALLLALASALVFALVAAWDAGRLDLGRTLKEAGGASTQRASRRSRRLLVVAQVAVVLATSAGLLSRSFWELRRVDPGFNPDRVLTVDLAPSCELPGLAAGFQFLHRAPRAAARPGRRPLGEPRL
jgi:putative ABC transport system permease protein